VIGLIILTEVERTSSTWWKSNTTFVLAHQVKKVYCLPYPCKKLSAWWVVHKVNSCEQLYTLDNAGYHDTLGLDDDIDEVYQEEELSASFIVEPTEGLNDLVGDADDIQMSVKRKWKPIKKKV
jgi:hypothetical protein